MRHNFEGIEFVVVQHKRNWTAKVFKNTTSISKPGLSAFVVGAGSRPELAIRDWKEQYRRLYKQVHPKA
jgi:hypothetical protein